MNRFTACATALIQLALSAPAWAQSWEVSGLAAYTPSVALDRQAPELSGLDIRGGFTWSVQGARLFTPHWGAEVLWTQQSSAQQIGTEAGTADLFTMTVRQLHGNVFHNFRRRGRAAATLCFWRPRRNVLQRGRSRVRDQALVGPRRRSQILSMERDWHPWARPIQADHAERRRCRRLLRPVRLLSRLPAADRVRRRGCHTVLSLRPI
jgi:hypothetical protein